MIDCNSYLGRFGAISKGVDFTQKFIDVLNMFNIQKSLVSSTIAILHDVKRGNEKLFKMCAHDSKLLPVAVVNPRWGINEAEEYITCGSIGIKLCPAFHRFSLLNRFVMEDIALWAIEKQIPLFILTGFNALSNIYSFISCEEIMNFCLRYPPIKILICGLPFSSTQGIIKFIKRNPNLYIETSFLFGARFIERLVKEKLENNICMGTGFGINSIMPGFSIVKYAEISENAKNKILCKNLKKFIIPKNSHLYLRSRTSSGVLTRGYC